MKEPISLHTSLMILASMKFGIIKQIHAEESGENSAEKISDLEQIYDMYCAEENLLYGGKSFEQLSVMDKIVKLYSPILKKKNSES